MPEWLAVAAGDVVAFVFGGGAALVVVNFWLNHKLKSVLADRQERYDEKVEETKLVKEYRRAIGRLFFWIIKKLFCLVGNGSAAAIDEELKKAYADFERADTALKKFDDDLVAKYKNKKG